MYRRKQLAVTDSPRPEDRAWVQWVAWVAVLAPALYSAERVLWALGIPIGISSEHLADLDAPGWGSATLLLLAAAAGGTAAFTYLFLLAGRTRVPDRVPGLGGRPVRHELVMPLLMLPIAILVYANLVNLMAVLGVLEIADEQQGWYGASMLIIFAAWGAALPISTWMYHRRNSRSWR